MRWLIFICLFGFALTAPQGYEYQKPNASKKVFSSFSTAPNFGKTNPAQPNTQEDGDSVLSQSFLGDVFETRFDVVETNQKKDVDESLPSTLSTQTEATLVEVTDKPLFVEKTTTETELAFTTGFSVSSTEEATEENQGESSVDDVEKEMDAIFNRAGSSSAGHTLNEYTTLSPVGAVKPSRNIVKHFYIHEAPEDTDSEDAEVNNTTETPTTHYNIVFVKAPSDTAKALARTVSHTRDEQKTIVYILVKKVGAKEVQQALKEYKPATHKPEVFFIKYKTPQEAETALTNLKRQYDRLGGETKYFPEGTVPVTSVIGKAGKTNHAFNYNSRQPQHPAVYPPLQQSSYHQNNDRRPLPFFPQAQQNFASHRRYLPPLVRI